MVEVRTNGVGLKTDAIEVGVMVWSYREVRSEPLRIFMAEKIEPFVQSARWPLQASKVPWQYEELLGIRRQEIDRIWVEVRRCNILHLEEPLPGKKREYFFHPNSFRAFALLCKVAELNGHTDGRGHVIGIKTLPQEALDVLGTHQLTREIHVPQEWKS